MTLGNMRANGVQSLAVSCWQCHHRTILSADPWPDHVPVPSFGPRMPTAPRSGAAAAEVAALRQKLAAAEARIREIEADKDKAFKPLRERMAALNCEIAKWWSRS